MKARLGLVLLPALLAACPARQATEAEARDAARAFLTYLNESAQVAIQAASSQSQQSALKVSRLKELRRALSLPSCPAGTSQGCTIWCGDDSSLNRSCESVSPRTVTCDKSEYKLSHTRSSLGVGYKDLTSGDDGTASGVLGVTVNYITDLKPTEATKPSRKLTCTTSLDVVVDQGSVASYSLNCNDFACQWGSAAIRTSMTRS